MLEEKKNGTVLKQFQLIGMTKNRSNPLGAKNNDSLSEKLAIVKFYTMEYRKCGNSNSKNDSRPCMGASAILKSVDFRAFAVNVKTIAPIQKLYQSGHAIWWYVAPTIINTFVESYDFSGKTIVPFATSGGSGMGKTVEVLKTICPTANWEKGKMLNRVSDQELIAWVNGL